MSTGEVIALCALVVTMAVVVIVLAILTHRENLAAMRRRTTVPHPRRDGWNEWRTRTIKSYGFTPEEVKAFMEATDPEHAGKNEETEP